MNPDEISVEEGDYVTLRLTSESPVEVHVHGYDLEGEVLPGMESDLSFEAETTGRFEIEDHETEAQLGTLLVQPR
jgi:heme/copper-type cytochrome/quinol oxidase subunit 2